MRLYLDIEFNFKYEIKKLICKYKGHKWGKPRGFYSPLMRVMFSEPIKECYRCGEEKYKKRKLRGVITWSRYNEIRT